MRALFIGRFQPPHRGHLHALRDAHRRFDRVLVVVGSAQRGYEAENPFTLAERVEMLMAALAEARLTRTHLYPLPDIHDNPHWVEHVEAQVPSYDVVVTHNPVNRDLFRQAGRRVEPAALWRADVCNGSAIRRIWAHGGDADPLLPGAVRRLVRRFGGPDRVRGLQASEVTGPGRRPVA